MRAAPDRISAIAGSCPSQPGTPAAAGPLVVIVAYHSDRHLDAALACLGGGHDVVIVDNSASPGTAQIASRAAAVYVPAPRNLGFAAAVNVGLREAWDGTRDVLLLNPDARVRWCDVLTLQQAMRARPRLAAAGPILADEHGSAQQPDWPLPAPGQVWLDALGLGRLWRGRRFITGAVLLLRAEALAQVGGFDERYFLYAEEADWQLRAQRLGWDVAVISSVTATHVGGASSSDPMVRERYFRTSAGIFAERWYGRRAALVMQLGSMAAAARRAVTGTASSRTLNRRVLRLYLAGGLRQHTAAQQRGTA